MESSFSESYKAAGVDITAGYKSVELMKQHIKRTLTPGAMSDIGGFGGLFLPDLTGIQNPVLVSGTDGVGTKREIAMRVAKPAASGSGCALIGGETAEHPGMMAEDDYDLAGFTVGVVDRDKIFDNNTVQAGDAIIALPSTGVHSNGFSLVRKVFDVENKDINIYSDELGKTVGEALLTPTKIYVKPVLALAEKVNIKAVSHITGGGFYENIPRSLPDGFTAQIARKALRILPIFDLLQKTGNIPERDMFNTYNMGVGMSLVVDSDKADEALQILKANGEDAYLIGEITKSDAGVVIA